MTLAAPYEDVQLMLAEAGAALRPLAKVSLVKLRVAS